MASGFTRPSAGGNAIAALVVAIGSFVVCPGIAVIIGVVAFHHSSTGVSTGT